MKTLFYGAGPLGSLYAHRLHQVVKDVTILARDERYNYIKEHGIVLVDEYTGEKEISKIRVVDKLAADDAYDPVVVLIRKNRYLNLDHLSELGKITGKMSIKNTHLPKSVGTKLRGNIK